MTSLNAKLREYGREFAEYVRGHVWNLRGEALKSARRNPSFKNVSDQRLAKQVERGVCEVLGEKPINRPLIPNESIDMQQNQIAPATFTGWDEPLLRP